MRKSHTPTEPSQRMLRVAEEIRHILSDTLRRGSFDDELLYESAHTINVTQVTVSPDLKHATAYILGLGGADLTDILDSLNEQSHLFQKNINNGLKMKFTPKVRFKEDDSYERVGRIEKILHDISREK
jgi:ribosome-binding factor A